MTRFAAAWRVFSWLCALSACTLRPLPEPSVPACPEAGASSLWECLDAIPREDRPESGFASTVRASDTARKRRDQSLPSACEGSTPPGFELRRVEIGAGRAPLVALVASPSDGPTPIVLVVHGLFDSKYTRYVQVTGELLKREGLGVVLPDMRSHGCLLSRQWLPTLGLEESLDLLAWGRLLGREHPGHPIGLVGFSLGGLDVLHAMGQEGAGDVFTAGAVAISPAADLPRLVEHLDAKVYFSDAGYTMYIRKGFRSLLRQRSEALGSSVDGSFAKTLDFLVSERPELGATPAEFLSRADPSRSVAASRRPLLILVTSNDPIIPATSIHELGRAAAGNRLVHLIETPYGGHKGQLGQSPEWFATILTTFFRYSPSAAEADVRPDAATASQIRGAE